MDASLTREPASSWATHTLGGKYALASRPTYALCCRLVITRWSSARYGRFSAICTRYQNGFETDDGNGIEPICRSRFLFGRPRFDDCPRVGPKSLRKCRDGRFPLWPETSC